MKYPPFADRSLLGTCIQLAQATFFDALAANAEHRRPVAPRVLAPKGARPPNALERGLAVLDDWFHRQRVGSHERYLAQAQNVFEVEARMREIDRRPQY